MAEQCRFARCLVVLALSALATSHLRAQPATNDTARQRIAMSGALTIERVSSGDGRVAVSMDAVQRLIVAGEWATPKAGDEVTLADGSKRAWALTQANADGALPAESTRGGYALWLVESDQDRIMLLNARGHGMAYVNGEPRAGDPYNNGSVSLPVKLKEGTNQILLQCPRGAVRAELVKPSAELVLTDVDMTLSDLVRGLGTETWGAAIVINASERPAVGVFLMRAHAIGVQSETELPVIPAMSARKVAFRVPRLRESIDTGVPSTLLMIQLVQEDEQAWPQSIEAEVAIAGPLDPQRRSFISDIDGSVQYFALRPALKNEPTPGLILTLHGADVEASGQAAAYASKDWAHIVAPTNRRKFGFDWEDWGRIDAIEVLRIAREQLSHDDQRVYLTGHSMGGHGTWQIGSTYPGLFAAIAPSAGWISFETYAGGRGERAGDDNDPLRAIMRRAGNPSRTLELQRNLEGLGVYVLHGDQDDNVPVEQARTMKAELAPWHTDLAYHEQPGAGHWWGNECVDWPPLMEFLRARVKPEAGAIDLVAFTTASPGVSASRDWITIQQQIKSMEFSTVNVQRDLAQRAITGTTNNIARLAIDVAAFGEVEISVELDGQGVRTRASPHAALELVRESDHWKVAPSTLASSHKNPARCGPFKAAFNHRFMLVYGTQGTAEENAWAINKARFDAETFWYRGNGSVDIVADMDFDANDAVMRDRSVILYGNADTNAAWPALLGASPVQVRRGAIIIGERQIEGDALACLLVRPRPGSDVASVGVVAGTGAVGARLTDRMPYFQSGVAYPDCTVLDGEGLRRAGDGRVGIRTAGYFGNEWSIEGGDFAFSQP